MTPEANIEFAQTISDAMEKNTGCPAVRVQTDYSGIHQQHYGIDQGLAWQHY